MDTYQFCINNDCRTACEAENETNAWLWLAEIKKLSVKKLKTLYTIQQKPQL